MIDFPDLQGNTPLHYASKYDHLDLCRILVGRGAFAGRKNDLGQSAYDISKCHIVRQYLLPLQFQSERQHIGGAGLYNGCDNGHMSSSSNYLMPIQLQLQPTEYDSEQPIVNGQLSWQQSQQYNIPPSVYNQTSAPLHQSTHNALDSISSSPHVPPYQLLQSQSQPVPHFQIPGGHLNINYNLNTSYNTPSPICDIYYNKLTDNRITAPVIVSTPNSSGTQSPVEPCSVNTDHSLSSISSYTPGMLNSTPVSSSCHNGPIVQSHNPITIFTASPIQSYRAPTTPSNIQSQSQIYSPSAPVTPRSPPHPFLSSNSNRSHLANNGSQMPQNMSQPMYQSTPLNAPTDPRQGLGPSAHGPPSVVMAGFRPTVKINNVNSGNNRIIQPGKLRCSVSSLFCHLHHYILLCLFSSLVISRIISVIISCYQYCHILLLLTS